MAIDTLPPPGEFQTTEEIRDANFARKLRRQRKLMLTWSAPVLLFLLLASIKLLSAVGLNLAGTSAYQQANYNTATERFEALEFFNVIQPWKAFFNQGTAIYASGEFFNASQTLEVALDLVPKAPQGQSPGPEECDVRTNLSLSYEGLGDEALAVSDSAMALNYYEQAQTVLSNCGESGGNGGEEAQEAEGRQQQQQQEAEQQADEGEGNQEGDQQGDGDSQQDGEETSDSPDPSGSGDDSSGSPTTTPTPSVDPQMEELESRNGDAGQGSDADEQASGGGNGSGQNW
ncbi:MAG: hypothetical protein ACK5KU_11755 [Beutenbergiaceae bacterium]